MYQDVTQDSLRASKLDEVRPLSPALEALGFEPLGLAGVGSEGAVAAIWVHKSGEAWAEPEWFPGKKPQLTFRTLFADGTIVQTSFPREGMLRLFPFWTRQHHPRAGYFLHEKRGMPHELWAAHKERIAAHASRRATSIPSHAQMRLFIAMAERTIRVARLRARVAQTLGLIVFFAVAIPVTFDRTLPGWVLPLTALLWAAASWGAFRLMLALPVPRIRPAQELLDSQR